MYKINLENLETKSYKNIPELNNKRVIVRSCLNVTVNEFGEMFDPTRFDESLPLIKELALTAKSVIVTAHLGRPKERTSNTSLWNVSQRLQEELRSSGITLKLINDLDPASIEQIQRQDNKNGKVLFLLENIRYFPGEESKDPIERSNFAAQLASLADVYVNDAFPDYREAASTYDIAKLLPSYIGPVFSKEVKAIAKFNNPDKPFIAVVGGAKLSEKLDALNALGELADKILIGGAMAYTLLKAKGIEIGKSLFEPDKLEVAKEILAKYGSKLVLPVDHLVAGEFAEDSSYEFTINQEVPVDKIAIDIGWETIKLFKAEVSNARSILWNGPMGVFEWAHSAVGTEEVGGAIVNNSGAFKFAGGGDSIAAINKFQLKGFDHISTGGGAMLALLSYDTFPTLDVILNS